MRVVAEHEFEIGIHARRIYAGDHTTRTCDTTAANAPSIAAITMLLVSKTGIDFLEPWCEFVPDQAAAFLSELKMELASDHPLYSMQLHPLGHSGKSDDAIFESDDSRIFQIHLTFSGRAEKTPLPRFRAYSNTAEWIQTVMRPANKDYPG